MSFALLILISLLGWGAAAYMAGQSANRAHPAILVFWGPLISLPVAAVAVFFGAELQPDSSFLLFVALSALSLFIARFFYLTALRMGEISPVVVLTATYPIVAMIILSFIHKEIPAPLALVGTGLVVSGVMFLQPRKEIFTKGLLIGLSAATFWGIWAVADAQALKHGNPVDMLLWIAVANLCLLPLLALWIKKEGVGFSLSGKTASILAASALLGYPALLAFYEALRQGSDIIAIVATSAYPLVTMWIAVARGDEKLKAERVVASVLIIAGLGLVNF